MLNVFYRGRFYRIIEEPFLDVFCTEPCYRAYVIDPEGQLATAIWSIRRKYLAKIADKSDEGVWKHLLEVKDTANVCDWENPIYVG